MGTTDRIMGMPSPRRGLYEVATIIEELEAQVATLTKRVRALEATASDEWSQWGDPDGGQPVDAVSRERVTVSPDGDKVEIDLPVADSEKQAKREAWAQEIKLDEQIPVENACEVYGRVGPRWLWLGNRKIVMSWPEEWRRAMVEDLMEDDIYRAAEMGRDILKQDASGQDTALPVSGPYDE